MSNETNTDYDPIKPVSVLSGDGCVSHVIIEGNNVHPKCKGKRTCIRIIIAAALFAVAMRSCGMHGRHHYDGMNMIIMEIGTLMQSPRKWGNHGWNEKSSDSSPVSSSSDSSSSVSFSFDSSSHNGQWFHGDGKMDHVDHKHGHHGSHRGEKSSGSASNSLDFSLDDRSVYDYESAYYENNSTNPNPTLKNQNDGNRFAIEVYKDNDIVSTSIRNSDWEYETVQTLNGYFKEYSKKHNTPLADLTFIDIGANIGWLTMNMAALGVKVIAFEPMEENLKLLRNTLKKKMNRGISDRVTLFEHGLGVKDETCVLYSDNTNFGDGHVKCGIESDLVIPANYTKRGLVPMKRLDDVINEEGMHIVAVNMDTEGGEGNVLEGGTKVLLGGTVGIIITEFVPAWVIDKGGDPVEFMKKMTDAKYRIKDPKWGYKDKKYMSNMTNFGSGEVTFHSPKLFEELTGGV